MKKCDAGLFPKLDLFDNKDMTGAPPRMVKIRDVNHNKKHERVQAEKGW